MSVWQMSPKQRFWRQILPDSVSCYKGEEYTLSLAGSYQTENAVLALEALTHPG